MTARTAKACRHGGRPIARRLVSLGHLRWVHLNTGQEESGAVTESMGDDA